MRSRNRRQQTLEWALPTAVIFALLLTVTLTIAMRDGSSNAADTKPAAKATLPEHKPGSGAAKMKARSDARLSDKLKAAKAKEAADAAKKKAVDEDELWDKFTLTIMGVFEAESPGVDVIRSSRGHEFSSDGKRCTIWFEYREVNGFGATGRYRATSVFPRSFGEPISNNIDLICWEK